MENSWTELFLQRLRQGGAESRVRTTTPEAMVKAVRNNEGLGFGYLSNQELHVPPSTLHIPFAGRDFSPGIWLLYKKTSAEKELLRDLLQRYKAE